MSLNQDEILKKLKSGQKTGFEALDDILGKKGQDYAVFDEKAWLLAQNFKHVFSTPEGQVVLDDLLERTLLTSTWAGSEGPPYDLLKVIPNGMIREGQNSIVNYILTMIKKAEKPVPSSQPET